MTRADLVQQIQQARFRPVRLVQGYDMSEVDDLLDALVSAVQAGMPVADLVGRARFTPVRLREGYAMREVDDFLRDVVAEAEGGRSDGPAPAPLPTVIEEQRGLLGRLLGGRRAPS